VSLDEHHVILANPGNTVRITSKCKGNAMDKVFVTKKSAMLEIPPSCTCSINNTVLFQSVEYEQKTKHVHANFEIKGENLTRILDKFKVNYTSRIQIKAVQNNLEELILAMKQKKDMALEKLDIINNREKQQEWWEELDLKTILVAMAMTVFLFCFVKGFCLCFIRKV
jgi:hypothetical protein